MVMDDGLDGKKIFVVLKSGRRYSGIVKSNEDELIVITDKYGEMVMFSKQEISSLEVER